MQACESYHVVLAMRVLQTHWLMAAQLHCQCWIDCNRWRRESNICYRMTSRGQGRLQAYLSTDLTMLCWIFSSVIRAEVGQGDKSNSRSDSSESISQTYLHKMLSSSCCISLPETKYLKIAVFAVQLSPYRQFPPWVVTYKLWVKLKCICAITNPNRTSSSPVYMSWN